MIDLAQLSWASTFWLWCLPLPWLLMFWMEHRPAGPEDAAGDVVLVHPAPPRPPGSVNRWRGWIWLQALAISLLLLAAARPQTPGGWLPQSPLGQRVMLVLDASTSMNQEDFMLDGQPVTRLDVLKGVVTRFIQARRGSHFGIVVFAGSASTFLPVTADRELATSMLARIQTGIAEPGTAIGDALALALKQIRADSGPRPVVMLFTDGESEGGVVLPAEALTLARELKVPLYTVAVKGFSEGQAIDIPQPGSGRTEPTLRDMAELSGGSWYQAGDAAALEAVIRDVDRLERTVTPPPTTRASIEWFVWPLWSGMALLLLAQLARWWQRGGRA